MKKLITSSVLLSTILFLTACGAENETNNGAANNATNNESQNADENVEVEEKGKIAFGQTAWTSTEAPTQIAKQILEEAGYEVEITLLDQPLIFEGLKGQEIDFFMDAWLPNTEEALWDEYQDDLQMVTTSY